MMKKKILWAGIILLGALTAFYCDGGNGNGGDTPETPISDPSFSNHIQPIFTNNCAQGGCHNSTAQAGLNLTQGVAYSNIVNVASTQVPQSMRVLPGDAANSYLVKKIEGTQTVGTRMPQGRNALSSITIQNIKNWVDRGAKNN
ncbi:MAG: hypothetical protein PVF66_06585 [Candidatus Aminicenantes bacterium]|jgi:hypothetical protein